MTQIVMGKELLQQSSVLTGKDPLPGRVSDCQVEGLGNTLRLGNVVIWPELSDCRGAKGMAEAGGKDPQLSVLPAVSSSPQCVSGMSVVF